MKRFSKKWLYLVALWLLIASCGSDQQAAHQDASHAVREDLSHKNLVILDERYDTPPAFIAQLQAVFQAYLSLKNAFVASDMDSVNDLSRGMEKAVAKLEASKLTGEGLVAAENHKSVLKHSLSQLLDKGSLREKRVHFSHISEALYCSIKSFGLETQDKIFTDYCPMAFEDRGAFWLSDAKEIRNPYFGDNMLTCGEIREVFE